MRKSKKKIEEKLLKNLLKKKNWINAKKKKTIY